MEYRNKIHNLKTLDREIHRLGSESRRMEKDLDNNFEHFHENYRSYIKNSFFHKNREDKKEDAESGQFSSFIANEHFKEAIKQIAGTFIDRVADRIGSFIEKSFGKRK